MLYLRVCKKDVRHIIAPQVPAVLVETPPPHKMLCSPAFAMLIRAEPATAGGIYF
jgi:hypothetical protein